MSEPILLFIFSIGLSVFLAYAIDTFRNRVNKALDDIYDRLEELERK